jgi:hypothetical protein
MNDRTERISRDAYRKLVGLPPVGQQTEVIEYKGSCWKLAPVPGVRGEDITRTRATFVPGPQHKGKQHHMLGRLGVGIMNKTEARYEREVLIPAKERGEYLWYAFEGVKLRLANRTFLTVDFFALRPDQVFEAIDVKGARAIVEEDAKVKMKVAAAMFPFQFRMVFPRPRALGGGWFTEEVKG